MYGRVRCLQWIRTTTVVPVMLPPRTSCANWKLPHQNQFRSNMLLSPCTHSRTHFYSLFIYPRCNSPPLRLSPHLPPHPISSLLFNSYLIEMATSSAAPAASASASASAALAGPSQPQPLPPPPTSPVSLASAEARLIRSDFRTLALAARVEQLDRALNLLTSKLVRCSSRVRGINHTDSHARSEAGVASLVASRSATVPPNLELCQRLKLNLPLGPSHGVQLLMRLFFKSAVHRIAQLLHHPTRILSVQRAFENCIEALWQTWVRGEISDNVAIECVGAVVRAIPIAHNYNLYADFLNWISPHVGISQQLSRNIANAEIPIDLIEIFGGPDTSRSRSPNGDVAVFFRERIDALRNNSNLLGNHQIYQHFIDVQQRRLTREWEQSALEFTSLKITFTAVLSTCLSESMSTNEIFSRIASVIPTPNINAGGDSNITQFTQFTQVPEWPCRQSRPPG